MNLEDLVVQQGRAPSEPLESAVAGLLGPVFTAGPAGPVAAPFTECSASVFRRGGFSTGPPLDELSRGAGEFAHSSHPRVIVEHGDTPAMFSNPQDRRTSDCVTGRFRLSRPDPDRKAATHMTRRPNPGVTRSTRMSRVLTAMPLAMLSAALTTHLVGSPPVTTGLATALPSATPAPPAPQVPGQPLEVPASMSLRGTAAMATDGWFAPTVGIGASALDIPPSALAAYQRAETVINTADNSCHISWQLIAAIGRVESDHGRFGVSSLNADGLATPGIFGIALDGSNNTARIMDSDAGLYDSDAKFDRAVGPMQFIPSTWRVVGVDADSDAERNPQDIDDAALAAAVYLCSGSDDLSTLAGQRAAVHRYNHSESYVDLVLSIMAAYLDINVAGPNSIVSAGYAVDPATDPSPDGAAAAGRAPVRGGSPAGTQAEVETPAPADDLPAAVHTDPRHEPPTEQPGEPPAEEPPAEEPPAEEPPAEEPPAEEPPAEEPPEPGTLTPEEAAQYCSDQGFTDDPANDADPYDTCVAEYNAADEVSTEPDTASVPR